MTVSPPVRKGPEAWVGSGAPDRVHANPPRLKLNSLDCYAFVKRTSPVPPGDAVSTGTLSVWVANDATGTFNLKLRRVASAIDWGRLTFNHMPGVTGTSQPTVTVTNPVAGQRLDFDVAQHLTTIAGGAKDYGWRIESDSDTDLFLVGDGSTQTPTLYAEHSPKPATPTDLAPAGTISLAQPHLTASADDTTGEDEVAKVQWQLYDAATGGTLLFDSGLVTAEALELDLSRTDLPGGTYAGIAEGTSVWQRCLWQNQAGVNSAWSDRYQITRKSKPPVTVNNPSGGVVHDITPILLATVDASVDVFRIRVVDPADRSNVLATSGKLKADSTSISWEVPAHVLVDGETYQADFDTWDDSNRVPAPGDPRFARTTVSFTVDEVNTVETPVLVSVEAHPTLPANVITLTTSTPPDTFTLYQDGDVHEVKISAVDAHTTGTSYQILDYDFTWLDAHTYRVRSVQDGKRSPLSNAITVTTTPTSVWVTDPATGRTFMLAGDGIDDWGRVDTVGEYHVHGSNLTVVISNGSAGYAGSFSGMMQADHGRTLDSLRADERWFEKIGMQPVLLRAANLTKWVVLLDLSSRPWTYTDSGTPRDQVSFRFREAAKPVKDA